MKAQSLLIAALLSVAPAAMADQWSEADALFARRVEGRAVIAEARTKYKAILTTASARTDKIRAVTALARLAIYEGEMVLPKTDTAGREAIFADCWKEDTGFTRFIAPVQGDGLKHEAYYYFKGVCLAWWGEAVGTLRSLPQVPKMIQLLEAGLDAQKADQRFESGSPHRLAAGIYSNKAAQPLGLYDPEAALANADEALASAAYPGADQVDGASFYENLRGRGQVLVELGRTADAKVQYDTCISTIQDALDADEVPAFRKPESEWVLSKCQAERTALN